MAVQRPVAVVLWMERDVVVAFKKRSEWPGRCRELVAGDAATSDVRRRAHGCLLPAIMDEYRLISHCTNAREGVRKCADLVLCADESNFGAVIFAAKLMLGWWATFL